VRFFADESCDYSVVRALRAAGHDVLAVAELMSGADDAVVLDVAFREDRILLTEDKDFGQLAYAYSQQSSGVILIRYHAGARKFLPEAVVMLVSKPVADLSRSFVVLSPGRVRIGGPVR
jgi:predicted nuclease of predicted toxin-antitoxin system